MKTLVKKLGAKISATSLKIYSGVHSVAETRATVLGFLFGALLLTIGLDGVSNAIQTFSEAEYDDLLVKNAVGNLFALIEGAFGALIMVVAGLGAIIAAAVGAYRAAVGMLVVAVGAFILRALVSLFFGADYTDLNAGESFENTEGAE